MAEKKNQHYVPQSYLARWTDESGLLHVFNKETGETFRANPRNVASQNYFYDSPGSQSRVEHVLAKIEDESAKIQVSVLEELRVRRNRRGPVQRQLLHRRDKCALALNISHQIARTERARDSLLIENAETSRLRHLRLMSGLHLTYFAEDLINYIWIIGIAGDGHLLYASDNPAFPGPPASHASRTGVPRFTELIYPLSPKCVLWLHDRALHKNKIGFDGRAILLDDEQTLHCNLVQSVAAHRFVFSVTNDFAPARRIRARERLDRTP